MCTNPSLRPFQVLQMVLKDHMVLMGGKVRLMTAKHIYTLDHFGQRGICSILRKPARLFDFTFLEYSIFVFCDVRWINIFLLVNCASLQLENTGVVFNPAGCFYISQRLVDVQNVRKTNARLSRLLWPKVKGPGMIFFERPRTWRQQCSQDGR